MTPGKSKNGKTPSSVNDLIPIIKAKKNGINANNNNKNALICKKNN
jgi:hypothetical protein